MKIRNTQQKDGRWFAEYINPKDTFLSGIGQFGKTEFEAKLNLNALLIVINEQRFKVIFNHNLD